MVSHSNAQQPPPVTTEALVRETIDRQPYAVGWVIRDLSELNLQAGQGVAVRERRSQGGLEKSLIAKKVVDAINTVLIA